MLLLSQHVTGTELLIRFVDKEEKAVTVSKVGLLLVAWGDTGRLQLSPDGSVLHLDLSPLWLRSRWPDRFADIMRAYLYVQADGFVPIRSDPFVWLGSHASSGDEGVGSVTIDFRQGSALTVKQGENAELSVTLRRPKPRHVTLLGDKGEPLSGVHLSAHMFWSASNHCGVLTGADKLGEFVTDALGRISLPDGDYEYALVLKDDRSVFRSQPKTDDSTLVSYLPPPDTTLRVHRFARRPLSVRLLRQGMPVAGVTLNGWAANCPCGACRGPIARSDAQGRITDENFYPEELEFLYICGSGGGPIWRSSPNDLPPGTLEIDLGSKVLSLQTGPGFCPVVR